MVVLTQRLWRRPTSWSDKGDKIPKPALFAVLFFLTRDVCGRVNNRFPVANEAPHLVRWCCILLSPVRNSCNLVKLWLSYRPSVELSYIFVTNLIKNYSCQENETVQTFLFCELFIDAIWSISGTQVWELTWLTYILPENENYPEGLRIPVDAFNFIIQRVMHAKHLTGIAVLRHDAPSPAIFPAEFMMWPTHCCFGEWYNIGNNPLSPFYIRYSRTEGAFNVSFFCDI